MKTYLPLVLLFVFLFAGCKKEEDAGPDLTSQFVGKFDTGYMVLQDPGGLKLSEFPTSAKNATIEYVRKSNNKLLVKVTIKDANVDLYNEFEATIAEDPDQTDNIMKEGFELVKKYRVYYVTGSSDSSTQLIRYKNNLVSGNISYIIDGKHIMAGFPW